MADHYRLLGIDRNAGSEEIKKAYRIKAKQFHPDVNPSPEASERFREIYNAYTVLLNPARRAAYDMGLTYLSKVFLRKKQREKDLKQNIVFNYVIAGLALLLCLVLVFQPIKRAFYKLYLGDHYSTTYAVFQSKTGTGEMLSNFSYSYVINDKSYSFKAAMGSSKDRGHYHAKNMFPVASGSRFMVRYNSLHPRRHWVDYNSPHPDDIQWLMKECLFIHSNDSENVTLQSLNRIYTRLGMTGLLNVYYQDVHPLNQLKYNSFTYKRMIKRLSRY